MIKPPDTSRIDRFAFGVMVFCALVAVGASLRCGLQELDIALPLWSESPPPPTIGTVRDKGAVESSGYVALDGAQGVGLVTIAAGWPATADHSPSARVLVGSGAARDVRITAGDREGHEQAALAIADGRLRYSVNGVVVLDAGPEGVVVLNPGPAEHHMGPLVVMLLGLLAGLVGGMVGMAMIRMIRRRRLLARLRRRALYQEVQAGRKGPESEPYRLTYVVNGKPVLLPGPPPQRTSRY